jgi:hypothetical protein
MAIAKFCFAGFQIIPFGGGGGRNSCSSIIKTGFAVERGVGGAPLKN